MERLSDTAIEIINDLHTERLEYTSEYIPLIDAANKLAEYEDLEEQGLLLRLPCKAGDTVYIPLINRIMEKQVISIIVQRSFIMVYCGNNSYPFSREDFGKEVFLTKEEAEAKLKELEGSKDK